VDIFDFLDAKVILIDIGASGGIHSRWKLLGDHLQVIGFEPDKHEFHRLPQDEQYIWLNTALHCDNQIHDLYATRWQSNTSLLKPNLDFIEMSSLRPEDFEIVKTVPLKCEKLDDVLERTGLRGDVVKIDTQGSELYILQGANRSLKEDIFAVEVEVEFAELYEDQPLFTDVDRHLRSNGFDLIDYGKFIYLKQKHTVGMGGQKGPLQSADALYFKRLDQVDAFVEKGDMNKLRRIIAVCLAYGYSDYAVELCYVAKRKNIFSATDLDPLIARLSRIKHYSYLLPNFPGRGLLAKGLNYLASLLVKVQGSWWTHPLGNEIRAYKW
jgi:FkbM family methyltransferase